VVRRTLKMKGSPRVRVLNRTRGKRMEKNPKKILVMAKGAMTETLKEIKDLKGIPVTTPEKVKEETEKVMGMVLRLERSLDPEPQVIHPKENLMDYLRRTPKKKGARRVR
jgi:hypothetical protein